MAPIYSTQLVNANFSGVQSGILLYTVPAGATVVITDIDLHIAESAAGLTSSVKLRNLQVLYYVSVGTETKDFQWVGKQVLNAGDTIHLTVNTTGISNIGITGYLLN